MLTDIEIKNQWEKKNKKKLKCVSLDNLRDSDEICYSTDKNENINGINLCSLKISDKSDISFIKKLNHLDTLDLSYNQISDISFLKGLNNLTTLDLAYNTISNISYLKYLNKLTTLFLSYNEISDISYLKELKYLTRISLRKNQIKDLPVEFVKLKIDIFWYEANSDGLNLYGNPLETPPIEFIKKGKEYVKAYFKFLEGEEELLNEVKVLFIGDRGSGKTSLLKQLLGETFDEKEFPTDGIIIKQCKKTVGQDKIKVYLWDFGGQKIDHAMRQIFLSKRSLYILVLDGSKKEKIIEDKMKYCLNQMEIFGWNCHVLIVINKIDKNPDFNVNQLLEKYKGKYGVHCISCKDERGIPDFKVSLRTELLNVELWRSPSVKIKDTIPESDTSINPENGLEKKNDGQKEESQIIETKSSIPRKNATAIIIEPFHISDTKNEVVRVAVVQLCYELTNSFPPTIIKKDILKSKVFSGIDIAKKEGANIVCLPELSLCEEWIKEIEDRYQNMIIIGGSFYKDSKNVCTVIIKGGINIPLQSKITPSAFEDPEIMGTRMIPGDKIYKYETQFGKFIVLICRDFENYAHYFLDKDIDFIFCPAFNSANERFHKEADNHVTKTPSYILIANTGFYGGTSIFGQLNTNYFNALVKGGCKDDKDLSYKLCEAKKKMDEVIIADFNLIHKSIQVPRPSDSSKEVKSIKNIQKIAIT